MEVTNVMFENDLDRLAYFYKTDKCPQIGHHYTPFYYELFKDRRESVKKVLELGIGYITVRNIKMGYIIGSSLYMWRDFFPNAQIYGIDIVSTSIFQDDRIETFLYDETKKEDLEDLIKKTGSDIDLLVDDGSHKTDDQIFAAKTLMPLLDKDVTYIIEDVGYNRRITRELSDYDCYTPVIPFRKNVTRPAQSVSRTKLVVVKHKA